MSAVHMYAKPQLRLDGQRPSISPQLKEAGERERLQEHPVTSPTTGQTRQDSTGSKGRSSSDASTNSSDQSVLGNTPTDLYSLSGFLGELLTQEKNLWERNESLRNSLRRESPEAPEAGSITSESSTTTLNMEDRDLYFIRYGQLTNVIHKYFRKLEKSHACLHLTARKANHDALRHVERTGSEEVADESSTVAREAVPHRANGGGASVVVLRDEDLLVYRCAFQCAQFPMLSAPCPPEGHSPTPPPPVLPSVFKTTSLEEEDSSDHPTSRSSTSVASSSKVTTDSSRPHFRSDTLTTRSSNSGVPTLDSVDGDGKLSLHSSKEGPVVLEARLPDSETAAIKSPGGSGKTKVRTKRRHPSDSSTLSKQVTVDSDEELELVKLVPGGADELGVGAMPSGREHPFSPMVNREMLLNLVREAFQQTEEQQINFEATLKQDYSRRSKGEILAKELVGQLQVLENNAHPFYKPKLFVTRNGYDLWLQGEKERVRRLIDKFWHCSLPRPQLWRNFNPIDYHKAYVILQRKVINAESRTDRKEPVYAGKTPSSPLSPTAQRLLTEFGLRYGVGELYRRIVYLEYLAKHFDYEIWYIKHCTEELRAIRHFVPRIRNQVTAVRREMDILRATIHLLHGQTDNSLTRIDRLFQNSDPRKGVAFLIELLAEVLDAELNLFGKKVRPVKDWLVRYLKNGFSLRYERRKQIASAETCDSKTVQPYIPPTLVNSLLLDTKDEVSDYRDKFQSVFRPYFDIVPFAKTEFYKHLSNDVCGLCASMLSKEETRKTISLEMLGLMYRLNERDMDWQSVIEPEMQHWRQRFQNLAIVWIDILGVQVQKWTVEAVECDEWTLLAFDMRSNLGLSSSTSSPVALERSLVRSHNRSWHNTSLATNTQIVSSIRQSPFPSPPAPELSHGKQFGGRVRIGGGSGAFTPYSMVKRPPKTSPISEASGAVTDSPSLMDTSSSTSLSIAGDYSHSFSQSQRKQKLPQDSILSFAQKPASRNGRPPAFTRTEDSHVTLEQPNRIEVSVSVYSGSDEDRFASISPIQLSSPDNIISPPTLDQIPEGDHAPTAAANGTHEVHHHHTKSLSDIAEHQPNGVVENGSTGQVVFSNRVTENGTHESEGVASGAVGMAHQKAARFSSSVPSSMENVTSPFKFNNLLDKCGVEDSEEVKSKPDPTRMAEPGRERSESNISDEFNRSPKQQQQQRVPRREMVNANGAAVPNISQEASIADHDMSTATHVSDETLRLTSSNVPETGRDDESVVTVTPTMPLSDEHESVEMGNVKPYLFPVSNSPLDLVTMLSRMAHFTGELLNTLVPKASKTEFSRPNKAAPVTEYAPEVTKARNKASERQKSAKQLKSMFLKKLNRTMINSLMLYADNMLCMDLCCWSAQDAVKLIGRQKLEHLKRRRDCEEIWGCRHMVEANHGLHPGGIPCHKKTQDKFECVTRDMCIRINNIHVLITIFHSLEGHIYNMVRTDSKRPISAFGYVSSDHSESSSNMHLINSKSRRPAPCRTHYKPQSGKSSSSWPSSMSNGLGPMEPDRESKSTSQSEAKKEDSEDSPPKQSLECLHYLKEVQHNQVKMIAIRMNKFCKRALSELLGLRLYTVSIEKRLEPIVDYLSRHRVALQKYIYPRCYNDVMENLWDCLLQDLEEEATKLRSSKRPVTDRAQMLLQSLTHLIQFMHDRGRGLDIDILNSTSEYLQGLLDIMTRSTDQLISIFKRLNAFHFAQASNRHASEAIEKSLIQQLRVQLRSNKKCFSGAEFVSKVMEVGRGALDETLDDVNEEDRQSPAHRAHLVDHTGNVIDYNEDYACTVGRRLLEEGIILAVARLSPHLDMSSTVLVTPTCTTDEEQETDVAFSYESRRDRAIGGRNGHLDLKEHLRREATARTGGARSDVTSTSLHGIYSAADGASQGGPRRGGGRQPQPQQGDMRPHADTSQPFSATPDNFYKFAGSEDAEYLSVMQSQILMSSSVSSGGARHLRSTSTAQASREGPGEENQDFQAAKKGTLYLALDLLIQRARKERVAKQFLASPRTQVVQEQKRLENSVNCDLIFKM